MRVCAAACALLFCLTALPLAGCAQRETVFTWQTDRRPDNLDPQLATDDGDRTAVLHLFRGLFRLDSQGRPQPDCCEEYSLSADGLTYRFVLRQGLTYCGLRGAACTTPVTADDFVFAFQRVFSPETKSPWAESFLGIRNAAGVLAGQLPADALGVKALDERTLTITLREPDADLLQKLCLPGAMPCCRRFFEECGGRYGLTGPCTLGNGPFYISDWTDDGLFLAREAPSGQVQRLRLVTDAGQAATAQVLPADAENTESFSVRCWALVFDTQSEPFSSAALRQALAAVTRAQTLPAVEGLTPADRLLCPALARGPAPCPRFDAPLTLLYEGLSQLGRSCLQGVPLYLPQEQPALCEAVARLNQKWQRELGVYFNLKAVSMEEAQQGEGGLRLVCLQAGQNDAAAQLQAWCGCASEAEALQQALAIPLYFQPQRLWVQPGYTGLRYDPLSNTLDVTAARYA